MSRTKRWAPWALLVIVAIGALVVGFHRSTQPTLAAEVTSIASEVRCPVCNGESAAESQSAPSVEIRNQIRTDLQRGMTSGQILDSFVASYGRGILEKPETSGAGLFVWVLPVVAVVIASACLVVVLARWRKRAARVQGPDGLDDQTPSPVSGEPVSGEPVSGEPVSGEPVSGEPVSGEPVSGEPVSGEPVSGGVEPELGFDRGPIDAGVPDAGSGTFPAEGRPRGGLADLVFVESTGEEARREGAAGEPAPAEAVQVRTRRVGRLGHRKLVAAGALTALVAALASWAVVHSSSSRLPGETVSGQAVGPEVILADLDKARAYVSKGDVLDAVKSYQKVLSADPTQVNALTEEGWLLVQTGEPALLQQGIAMMRSAEQSNPAFSEAHLYRGLALLSEDDYSDAIPELQWYLAHSPDPQLVAKVGTALRQAQASLRTSQALNGSRGEPSASPAPEP